MDSTLTPTRVPSDERVRNAFRRRTLVGTQRSAMARISPFRDRVQLYWSRRGEVACEAHAPIGNHLRWTSERWRPVDQREHRLRLQCQTCHAGSPIQRRIPQQRASRRDEAPVRAAAAPSRIAKSLVCSRCHKVGLITRETLVQGDESRDRYTCRRCGHWWTERTALSDANRRIVPSDRRRVSRSDRRVRG
jgi:DNA-directed RNA polymerase subunit M/transcription elongation factor TFIIS